MTFKYHTSICAIYKNEAPYIREWIEYHLLIGIDHFYLYNNLSDDDHYKTLLPYIENGIVTYAEYNKDLMICDNNFFFLAKDYPYNDVIYNYKNESKWIGFIDLDEFITIYDGTKINNFIDKYDKYAGLAINWLIFGGSNNYMEPEGLIIENYILRAKKDFFRNRYVKCIINPRKWKSWYGIGNSHLPTMESNIVKEDESICSSPNDEHIIINNISIHHYYSKSKWFYIHKKIGRICNIDQLKTDIVDTHYRPKAWAALFYTNVLWWDVYNLFENNCIEDNTMLKWVPLLKQKLGITNTKRELLIDHKKYLDNPNVLNYYNKNKHLFKNMQSLLFHYWFIFDTMDISKINLIPVNELNINIDKYNNQDFMNLLYKYVGSEAKLTPSVVKKYYIDYELTLPDNFDPEKYKSLNINIKNLNKYETIIHWATIGQFHNMKYI